MSPKLYELTASYRVLANLVETDDENDWTIALETLQGDIAEKAENVAKVIRHYETDADAYDAEAKRLADKARAAKNAVVRLKDYLKANLEACGLDKIKGPLFTVALQANPPACQIVDETAIPAAYKTLVPEHWELATDAKRRIVEAWKAGQDTPGAEVSQGRHVRVR